MWVKEREGYELEVLHWNGKPWSEVKRPWRFHLCRAQTRAWVRFNHIERCACGALRFNEGKWQEKNSRKK